MTCLYLLNAVTGFDDTYCTVFLYVIVIVIKITLLATLHTNLITFACLCESKISRMEMHTVVRYALYSICIKPDFGLKQVGVEVTVDLCSGLC
jgi:hypothetical protein